MTAEKEKSEEVLKISSPFAKFLKTHGLSVTLMLGGLYFLNGKLEKAEDRILAMEIRIFDCYEKRLQEKDKKKITEPQNTSCRKLEFIPPYKKNKYGYTLI
jgi:hypothetical protein